MNHQRNPQIHHACETAFAMELARTIQTVLARQASLQPQEKQALLSELLFGVCAHLSGSSFAGRIEDQEVYPLLGFSVGENGDTVYFGGGSALHEKVQSILGQLSP